MSMSVTIHEMRTRTKLTQQAFADLFGIPVSTLRKWEQGEASPPAYVVRLIAKALPQENQVLQKIEGKNGPLFYYNPMRKSVLDTQGNEIAIQEDLEGVKEQNLILYLEDLFEDFHAIQKKFNRDCYYDKKEDIIWTR